MAEATPTGFVIGDRSQGYEVTGTGAISGPDAAYAGKDTRDRDAAVTLMRACRRPGSFGAVRSGATFEQLDRKALVGPRTWCASAPARLVVIGKEAMAHR
jgi:hypothetical protein